MEKTANQKIKLGLFVVIGTILFVSVIYFMGNKQNLFGNTITIKAIFGNVNGLQKGNNVRFAGIDIGTVNEIEMINDSSIVVNMVIKKKMINHIKKNAIATINSDGLVGNMIVNIIPGKGNALEITEGDVIQSYSRINTEAILETLNVTNENAALLTADLLKITNEIIQGKGTVGLLIKDSLLANELKETMYYLKITAKETSQSASNLNQIMSNLNHQDNVIGVLNDTVVAKKIKIMVSQLEETSLKIDNVVSNLNQTIGNAKDGKGAINYLSNDTTLVKKIDSTMTNLQDASYKINENLEALKHNIFFRGYFKKIEKEKNK